MPTFPIVDCLQYVNWDRAVFEQMRQGGVTVVHATIAYHENTREVLRTLGVWNRHFANNADLIMPIRSVADLAIAQETQRTGIIFGFQNPSPLEEDLSLIEIFAQLGVKFMQLTYNNQSSLASSCYEDEDSGIRRFGHQAIAEMNRVGMVIDMSHSGERSTLEAIEVSARPITVTHANPHAWRPIPRNKSRAVMQALAQSGGMLGFSLYPLHLKDESACTLAAFCEMVAGAADVMGVDNIGIGSDLCQNQPVSVLHWMRYGRWTFEAEQTDPLPEWPAPLPWFQSNADFPAIAAALQSHGFSEADVSKIMGGNWLRFFEASFTPFNLV